MQAFQVGLLFTPEKQDHSMQAFQVLFTLKNRIILCKHFKVSNNILFWYKCEDLQCIDLFGINQNVAQKYSPKLRHSVFKIQKSSSFWGGESPSHTPLCMQARNWRWRATRSSPNVQNGSTPLSKTRLLQSDEY